MSTKFIGVSTANVVGTSFSIDVPSRESLLPGDILFAFIVVQSFTVTTITVPTSWSMELSPPNVADQVVFTAIHYVGTDPEPATYSFSYAASRPIVAIVGAYRAAKQDVLFDPVNYPFGYYAPAGSTKTARTQTIVTAVSTVPSGSSSLVPFSRGVFFFGATHASLIPVLSDVSPLVAIRAKVQTTKVSAVLCDTLEAVVLPTLPVYSVASSVTLSGAIGVTRVLEPLVAENDSLDTFKAKLMRRMAPPLFDTSFDKPFGALLSVIGGSDNDAGGLFGDADFLPDEV